MQRSPGILPSDSAQRLRGWLTVHPWTGSQLARIPASHPRIESGAGSSGFSSATAPLHRGPNYCASCAAKTKQIPALANFRVSRRTCSGRGSFSSFSRVAGEGAAGGWGALALASASASAPALRSGAQDARYPGPVSGGGWAQERPAGWARGIAPSSLPAHGGAVSEPPEPCRAVAGQEPGDHRFGVAFSLPTFLLATQEKVGRSPKASESLAVNPLWLRNDHPKRSDSLAQRRVKALHFEYVANRVGGPDQSNLRLMSLARQTVVLAKPTRRIPGVHP